MNQPLISIITPSFNRAEIVHETADSIFNQTYINWEWIIVDDGSTDNSWDVLNEFVSKDPRVKIFKRDREPKGACMCRNIAVENCSGDYLIFLDTDDLLAPFCLEQRLNAMQNAPDCDFIIFPMLLFKKEVNDLGLLWNVETGEDDLFRILAGDPICQGTGTLWKKNSFVRIGMWNVELKLWQDIELHIRSLLSGMVYEKRMDLPPDVYLRISDISLSRTAFHSLPKLKSRMDVFYAACKAILTSNTSAIHEEGIRIMGLDIIMNAIKSGYYTQANELIIFCGQKNVFTKSGIDILKRYRFIWKYKFYKIGVLVNYFNKRVNQLAPEKKTNIGKIKWREPKEVYL